MTRYARIAGTGSYAPEKTLTNHDLSLMLGEDINEFVSGVIGINERHICAEDESTADLAVRAAERALATAGIAPAQLDLIILATDTPEFISPATSSLVQSRLGAINAATFDVNCACAGFVTALDAAAKFISADEQYNHVLVIGAYAMSKFLNWNDKKTCTLFADGAGAVVLQASTDGPGFLASQLAADGNYYGHMGIYAGGARQPLNHFQTAQREQLLEFVQKIPSSFNLERWPQMIGQVLKRSGLMLDDVGMFFFTQLNLSTIRTVMKTLAQPLAKAHTIMDKWGYTGSACIPMALDDAARQGKLKSGDVIILCGSGGGVALGCLAFRWT
ncbi:MAG: ketoacyl-ACP synthase III [Acidobacteria bacterium]|nr:ketoacyl-ACP synthase III [Acidobacteriota bacterium]MBI3422532.1 ketoacyl-ACP synthase III [Acidobacteriota bacterium]